MHKICAAVRHPRIDPCRAGTTPGLLVNPLISLNFVHCLFLRQFKQSVDFQGLRRDGSRLSTKLSTEALDMSVNCFTSST
jgi:hypothetical protein